MRVVLDHNVTKGIRDLLPGHDVRTAFQMGWAELTNGALLDVAEGSDFDVMVTGDLNLAHQQNLTGRRLIIVALDTTHWPTLRKNPDVIADAVSRAEQGSYIELCFPRRALRRRPAPL